jgi:hypothetical protein
VSVNFILAVFSVLDFFTPEDGTKCGPKGITPYAVSYLRREEISHDSLLMQAIVWLHVVKFRAIRFDTVQFGASYLNLK